MDPSVSARHRVSPYPLVSFEKAIDIILEEVQPLSICRKSVSDPVPSFWLIIPRPSQPQVSPALKGYVLAEDVLAPQNVPFTYTTSVDGYALRCKPFPGIELSLTSHHHAATDPPGVYKVVTSQTHTLLPIGSIYRINTGGPLPTGADTVIMVEDTRLVSTQKDVDGEDGEEYEVETMAQVPAGENVRQPGSDVKTGDLVLQKEGVITSLGGEIGTLTFVGRKEVSYY
jgi:gephyrin